MSTNHQQGRAFGHGSERTPKCSVRRVTRHRIPDSIGKNSEEVLGSTDLPQSESQGGQQHVGKAAMA